MTTRLVLGVLLAVLVAALITLIWIPGCGWIDVYIYLRWGCDAAGGGGGGAA